MLTKYIDAKQLITIVLAGVALFFLTKYFTRTVKKADGTQITKVGNYVGE
jgi:hypothetical protein